MGNSREKVAFSPDDAVDRLAGRAPYSTDGKGLGNLLRVAIVALSLALGMFVSFPLHPDLQ